MKNRNRFQTVDAVVISVAHLLHDVYSSFLAPILPLLIEKLGISYSAAGFLSVAQRLPSLLNPAVGLIADKVSVRYFLIVAPSITAISMSLLGVAPSYHVLVGLLVFMGVGSLMFHVPAPVMMRRVSGKRVGLGMSLFMVAGEGARSIGPLMILGAVALWGLEGTWRLIPLGLACSFFLFARIRNIRISDEFRRKETPKDIRRTIRQAMSAFKVVAGFMGARSLMKGALSTFLPLYLTHQGASLWLAGISLTVVQFSGAAGTLFSGTLSDKIGRKKTLMITAVSSPILMGLFLMVEGPFLFPLLMVIGFFLMAPTPVLLASVNEIKSDHPAFVNSVYMMINFTISSVAALLVGLLSDVIGFRLTYQIAVLLSIGAIPVTMRMKR
jgi:FSR family fosmidomycin resistance protein-like MFS transporter